MVDIPRIKFFVQRRYRTNWPFLDGHYLKLRRYMLAVINAWQTGHTRAEDGPGDKQVGTILFPAALMFFQFEHLVSRIADARVLDDIGAVFR
jgi:hypothetical protein